MFHRVGVLQPRRVLEDFDHKKVQFHHYSAASQRMMMHMIFSENNEDNIIRRQRSFRNVITVLCYTMQGPLLVSKSEMHWHLPTNLLGGDILKVTQKLVIRLKNSPSNMIRLSHHGVMIKSIS